MEIKLVSPDELENPIIGILLENGSISDYKFSYDKTTNLSLFLLPGKIKSTALSRDGDDVLVDSKGQEWRSMDVIYHSLLRKVKK